MYLLYQIGDVPFFSSFVGFDGDAIEIELSSEWDAPSQEATMNKKRRYTVPSTYSLTNPVSFSVTGVLRADGHLPVSAVRNRIRSFAGRRDTPIIVVQYDEDFDDVGSDLLWLVAYGIVVDMPKKSNYGGNDVGIAFKHQEFELEVELTTPFRQMETAFWEYRTIYGRTTNNYSQLAPPATGQPTFRHPLRFQEIVPTNYFVKWITIDDISLDPEYWGVAKQGRMSVSGAGSDFADIDNAIIFSNQERWTEPPLALYAFTNLIPYGSISIDVELKTGLYYGETVSVSNSLNLATLNTDLISAGYGGLYTTDIVYTGAVMPKPGYIYRGGEILSAIRPAWVYQDSYPGYLTNGYTEVRFTRTLNEAHVAYLFDFGVY